MAKIENNALLSSLKENIEAVADALKGNDIPLDEGGFLASKTLGLTMEIYPEDSNYNAEEVLEKIETYCREHDCLYAYISHSKDIYQDNTFDAQKRLLGRKGEVKKAHIHVVVRFNYRTLIGDFCGSFNVPARFIKKLKNDKEIDNMLLYLSHIKYPKKHQYDYKEIKTNRPEYVEYLHLTYKPSSCIKFAINELDNTKGRATVRDMYLNLDDAGMSYDDMLKSYHIWKDLIIEHNERLSKGYEDIDEAMLEVEKYKTDVKKLCQIFGSIVVEEPAIFNKYRDKVFKQMSLTGTEVLVNGFLDDDEIERRFEK